MDNDHLFVCFSSEALVAPQGVAPFYQEIKTLASELDEEKFEQFFEGRFNWHWYPIVSSGMSSFPTHGDLPGELTEDGLLRAIGYASTICAREEGKRFISGLGLLSLLCRSLDEPKSEPTLTKNFMKIPYVPMSIETPCPNSLVYRAKGAMYGNKRSQPV